MGEIDSAGVAVQSNVSQPVPKAMPESCRICPIVVMVLSLIQSSGTSLGFSPSDKLSAAGQDAGDHVVCGSLDEPATRHLHVAFCNRFHKPKLTNGILTLVARVGTQRKLGRYVRTKPADLVHQGSNLLDHS